MENYRGTKYYVNVSVQFAKTGHYLIRSFFGLFALQRLFDTILVHPVSTLYQPEHQMVLVHKEGFQG